MHITARPRSLIFTVGLSLAALLFPSCVSRKDYDARLGEIRDQNQLIKDQQAALDEMEAHKRDLEKRLAEAGVDSDERQRMKEQYERELAALRDLEQQLRAKRPQEAGFGTEDKGDWNLFHNEYGAGVRIKDDLLFPLGSAELSTRGKEVLREVAESLEMGTRSGRILRVVGHTDDTPIVKPETKAQFPFGNLQLSAERAVVVGNFLIEECNVPRDRLGVEGYGDTRPLQPNTSPETKAANRRCEIYIVDREPAR